MQRHSMYLYPWDLRDEGAGNVADRLRATGIDGVTLATSYHAGKFLRPHAPSGKVYFPEDGTVYFTPDSALYRELVPQRARMADDYDALRAVATNAADLAVTAWTVGLHNTRLGQAHPHLTTQTVYGDKLVNALCPAQPEVRHYLTALCVDTATQPGVGEIALETPGWQAFRHGHHHEFELIELPDRVQVMMGTCFCPACRAGAAAAGVDIAGLADDTRHQLDRFFAEGTPPATNPQTDPDWQAYIAWRAGTVTGLVAEIVAAIPANVGLAIIPTTQTPNSLCWIEGSDLAALAKVADRLEVPAYQTGVAQIAEDAAWVRKRAGDDARIGYIVRPTFPHLADSAEVVQAVSALRALGPSSISFYNYGHMRLSALDWIATALA
ncbi:hypothetical protein GCM10011358_24000 [Sinisalibacter lacisalsi]|uniref:Alanine-rich protein n=2 Tax=Sinisalibacter lacisalsi TaxID=1526570 RepID=A0ABQ1QRH6_9RHOB|nr:hypothetical protein GCM10011358_24000 [Sinisalibacter lacisalsi]